MSTPTTVKNDDIKKSDIVSSDDDSDDDDEIDELMSFCPFSPESASKNRPKKEEAQSEPVEVKQPEQPESESDIEKAAAVKASTVLIPNFVKQPSQFVWHNHTKKGRPIVSPCRLCDPDEVVGLHLPQTWDPREKALIQYIEYPRFADRDIVPRKNLTPYHGKKNDDNACRKDRDSTADTGSLSWCPKFMDQYLRQRKRSNSKLDKVSLRAEAIFLDLVLENARKKELQSKAESLLLSNDENDRPTNHVTETIAQDSKEPNSSVDDDEVDSLSDSDPYSRLEYCDVGPVSKRKTDQIRSGDVLEYYTNQFVSGDKRGLRHALVLSVDPKRNPVLVLDNAECLPIDTQVKRVLKFFHGKHISCGGKYQPIERYKLRKSNNPKFGGEGAGAASGLKKEIDRVGQILRKNRSELQEKMDADGTSCFASLLHKCGKTDDKKNDEEKTEQDAKQASIKSARNQNLQTKPSKKQKKRKRNDPPLQNKEQYVSRSGRRVGMSDNAMTESQMKLAAEVKKFLLEDDSRDDQDDDDCNACSKALDELSQELDITTYRLGKFLQGDEKRLIKRKLHEETEAKLREWLSSKMTGKTSCDTETPEAQTKKKGVASCDNAATTTDLAVKEKKKRITDPLPPRKETADGKKNQQYVTRSGRRGGISQGTMTESQIKLASEVKEFLMKKAGKKGDITYSEVLVDLSQELGITEYRLEKFLKGDEQCLIKKQSHEKTELLLRKWLSSKDGGDSGCGRVSLESQTTADESI